MNKVTDQEWVNNIQLYNCDCMEGLKKIDDNSVDLVVIDPPYNIKKAEWDSWKNIAAYVEFMGSAFLEFQRVLKDNGSFYFFHNDFMQIVELQNFLNKKTNFIFNSMIHWIKPTFRSLSWKNPSEESNLRSWFNCVEYCLFYTFQESTGLEYIEKEYIAPRNPFAKKLKEARIRGGKTINQVAEYGKFYGKVNHGGSVSNWEKGYNIPSKEQWGTLCGFLPIERENHKDLNKEYQDLRKEYEDKRYTHNLERNHNNIWTSKEHNSGKEHSCKKPLNIIKRIIKASSNEGDTVLDCFMGSGQAAIACHDLKRNFIGMDNNKKNFNTASERLKVHQQQLRLL